MYEKRNEFVGEAAVVLQDMQENILAHNCNFGFFKSEEDESEEILDGN
jgi:hypothetical protein